MSSPQIWDANAFGTISLEAVKERHQPAYKFRIQKHLYVPHTPYHEAGVTSVIYVLSGWIQITSHATSEVWKVRPGQYLQRPQGSFTISHPEGVEIIKVLKVPHQLWPKEAKP